MADKRIQTPNFGFQMIEDGTRWADMTRTTAVPGVGVPPGNGNEQLEPADYNTMLTILDGGFGAIPTGFTAAGTIAATGTTAANGTPITSVNEVVTGANATTGVTLPPATAGARIYLVNNAAAILKVWPHSVTETINSIAAGTDIAMAANTSAVFICAVAGAWFTIPTVPS